MPTIYRPGKLEDMNNAISGVGNVYLQKMLQDQQEKKKLEGTINQSLLEAALKNMRPKEGANLGAIDTSKGMQGILGQIPGMFENVPDYKQRNEQLINVLSGLEQPSATDISTYTPQLQKTVLGGSKPISEGGYVGLPSGATFGEGQIKSSAGERIGEYLPGYEPKNLPVTSQEVSGAMRKKLAPGVSQEELSRKALGLPRFTGRATQGQVVALATKLAQAENPMATETDIKAKMPAAQAIFSGQAMNNETDVQSLIEEYQTTTDPARLKELEEELTAQGVNIQ